MVSELRKFTKGSGKAMHRVPPVVFGSSELRPIEFREINVMTVSGKYAMVRRSGCMPYVAQLKEIFELDNDYIDPFEG